ncbi:MAG: aminoglycoside phosphotransferase family protein [Lentisphaerae bacterium]|nr:aminoglycoside phosphotransferase family protein [Lentisphaerota bacterium]
MKKDFDFSSIASSFMLYGDLVSAAPYGNGHINDTFELVFNQSGNQVRYILQRINTNIFRDPVSLMENISRVTAHQKLKSSDSRQYLTLVSANDGKKYVVDAEGNYFRAYLFIENATSYDILETPRQAYEAARAFGRFQADLADITGGRLVETIPDFHNTPVRVQNLENAIRKDACNRVREVAEEIDFVLSRKDICSKLIDLQKANIIPERITHNDTKLNNVMIDNATGRGICVIDLDTVMPGLVHYDFGDMVRTGTSPAPEDERDLGKIFMRFENFEALLRGYCSEAGKVLNDAELENLPFAGALITLEIGTRFLTDYLEGDVYFKTHREGHNLDRARSQFQLVRSIESQYNEMMNLLNQVKKEIRK